MIDDAEIEKLVRSLDERTRRTIDEIVIMILEALEKDPDRARADVKVGVACGLNRLAEYRRFCISLQDDEPTLSAALVAACDKSIGHFRREVRRIGFVVPFAELDAFTDRPGKPS